MDILIGIVVIGGAGWYFWNKRKTHGPKGSGGGSDHQDGGDHK
jgi:hypothetical protein